MSASDAMMLTGVFASRAEAERASGSLLAQGIPEGQLRVITTRQLESGDFSRLVQPAAFSESQIESLTREVDDGRTIVIVQTEQPGDEVISILGANGALHIEMAEMASTEQSRQTLPLLEEQLKIDTQTQQIGEVIVRKTVEEVPAQAEVEARHEELDVEHVYVGQVVDERRGPWREGEVLVVPVYEEQLTVVRKLVMREQLRITLHQVSERHTIADTVKREHAVVEDPDKTHRVRVRDRGSEVPPTHEPETPSQHDR